MPYRVRCKECKEFIYIFVIIEQRTNYPCPSCNIDNEFDKMDFDYISTSGNTSDEYEVMKTTFSHKYSILNIYKGLAYLLMIVNTVLTVYSFVQISEASNAMKKYGGGATMDNALITLIVAYVISMFSLFCLTKMIDFLFDLDKHKSDK